MPNAVSRYATVEARWQAWRSGVAVVDAQAPTLLASVLDDERFWCHRSLAHQASCRACPVFVIVSEPGRLCRAGPAVRRPSRVSLWRSACFVKCQLVAEMPGGSGLGGVEYLAPKRSTRTNQRSPRAQQPEGN